MRVWARNLKAICRGKRLNFGEGGQEQEPQAGEDGEGAPGSCQGRQVSISKSTMAVPAQLRSHGHYHYRACWELLQGLH